MLQYSFNWKQLSVIAGVSFWNFYFRFHAGAIRGPQFVYKGGVYGQGLYVSPRDDLVVVWFSTGIKSDLPDYARQIANDLSRRR